MKNINLSNENLNDINKVVGYLIESEKKSYEEYIFNYFEEISTDNYNFIFGKYFYNNPEVNHIYATARRVKDRIR